MRSARDFEAGLAAYDTGDYQSALKQWTLAAESGNPKAQYNLGLMYHFGLGVAVDEGEAARWFSAAAGAGDAEAQHNLALLYERGGRSEDRLCRGGTALP